MIALIVMALPFIALTVTTVMMEEHNTPHTRNCPICVNASSEDFLKVRGLRKDFIILSRKDGKFREIGNIVEFTIAKRHGKEGVAPNNTLSGGKLAGRIYVLAYSIYFGKYDGYDVYVGLAISKNWRHWEDLGIVIKHAEDPYLVVADRLSVLICGGEGKGKQALRDWRLAIKRYHPLGVLGFCAEVRSPQL